MNDQPYPKYKESGVQWLGEVPEHWEVWKLSHGFERTGSGTTPPSVNDVWYDGDIAWVTTSELRETVVFDTVKKVSKEAIAEFSALKIFPRGALGIAMYGATIGRLGIFGIPATTNQACCVMFGEDALTVRFMFYWLLFFRDRIILLASGGGQPNISQEKIRSIRVPCPNKTEQTAIADFLDRETGRIDTLVAKNKKLIELLKEERSALISRTVTRGLPEDAAIEYGLEPHTRFKDSGVEWLGEVPEGWEVKRLKYSASINDEILPETTKPDFDFLYVDIGSVTLLEGIIRKESMTFEDAPSRARRKARAGDAIVSTVRTYLRAIASIPETDDVLIVSTGFAVIRSRLLCPRYLGYALKESSFVEQVVARSVGVSYPAVNASEIGDIAIPLPSENEQTAIADFLDCETGRIDNLIGKVEALITRLQEYRIAIITDAVTGKIDVREMAA